MTYEMNQSGPSDDEMSLLSGQTPDLLSAMSTRHRHTSRHSLLDEIVKQVRPLSHSVQTAVIVTLSDLHVHVYST